MLAKLTSKNQLTLPRAVTAAVEAAITGALAAATAGRQAMLAQWAQQAEGTEQAGSKLAA